MSKFIITTSCEAITDYTVEADSPEQAREKFINGEYEEEEIKDYMNEQIDDIQLEWREELSHGRVGNVISKVGNNNA